MCRRPTTRRRVSTARQTFTVNNTLGDVKLSRRGFVARERGKQFVQAGVTLTRPARLTVTVETRTGGVKVATIAVRRLEKGRFLVRWNGTTRAGRAFVYGGDYVLRFRAANELGVTELVEHARARHGDPPRAEAEEAQTDLRLVFRGAGRLDPVGDHRPPDDAHRRLRPLRRLPPDARRRGLSRRQRARDGLLRRPRGGRVPEPGGRALRLRVPGGSSRLPCDGRRGHDRLHDRSGARLVDRPARRETVPREPRPLGAPERARSSPAPSAGSSAGRTRRSSWAGSRRSSARSSPSPPASSAPRSAATRS